MFKRMLPIMMLVILFSSSPALAAHCTSDVEKINAALLTSDLPSAKLEKVKTLTAKGLNLHLTKKKHTKSLEKLHKAMKILGVDH